MFFITPGHNVPPLPRFHEKNVVFFWFSHKVFSSIEISFVGLRSTPPPPFPCTTNISKSHILTKTIWVKSGHYMSLKTQIYPQKTFFGVNGRMRQLLCSYLGNNLTCQNPTKGHVGFSWRNCRFPPPQQPFFFVVKKFFSNFLKKCRIFSENSTNIIFLPQKEKEGKFNNFSRKIRHDLSLGFDVWKISTPKIKKKESTIEAFEFQKVKFFLCSEH